MSESYEAEIERQPSGPFSRPTERKTIRWVAERAINRQRYLDERSRRFQRNIRWIVYGAPAATAIYKIGEAIFARVF